VTSVMVRDARMAELKREVRRRAARVLLCLSFQALPACVRVMCTRVQMLASNALKAHFEDNPKDLDVLRHEKPLHPNKVRCRSVVLSVPPWRACAADCVTGGSGLVWSGLVWSGLVWSGLVWLAAQVPAHLAKIPDYLIPPSLKAAGMLVHSSTWSQRLACALTMAS
jgi:hypothetical protein